MTARPRRPSDCEPHVLKLYECQDATRLWSGSAGSYCSQPGRSWILLAAQLSTCSRRGADRFVICCMPCHRIRIRAGAGGLPALPPSPSCLVCRHATRTASVDRSKTTASFPEGVSPPRLRTGSPVPVRMASGRWPAPTAPRRSGVAPSSSAGTRSATSRSSS